MKKNALMILAAGLISFGTFAQDKKPNRHRGNSERPTPEKIAEQRTNRLKEKVNLNDEQYKKLYAIHLEDTKKQAEERKEAHKRHKAELNKKYASVLSKEQLQTLETAPKKIEGDRKDGYRNRTKRTR